MRVMCGLILMLGVAGLAWAEQPYYQADPARLAQLEAERCQRWNKEARLIRQRLSRPVERSADAARMKIKLQSLAASAAQYCPVSDASSGNSGQKR